MLNNASLNSVNASNSSYGMASDENIFNSFDSDESK